MAWGWTLAGVIAATVVYALCEHWMERWFGTSLPLRRVERYELWALRLAGVWLTFWLFLPLATAQTLSEQNRQQIVRNATRLENLDDRIGAIERLRIDARLSAVEETREEVKAMRQWVFGIFGGVLVTVIVQILQLRSRQQWRR